MTALITLEPAFAIHRLDPKLYGLSPGYRDSSVPPHLQEARVWIREPSNGMTSGQRWSRFTGQDVLLLLEDMNKIRLTDEKRELQRGAVRHSSHTVHRLRVFALSKTSDDSERDYEITLGNEWSRLSLSLGSVIERHLQADMQDSDMIFVHTEVLGGPRPQEDEGFLNFLKAMKREPSFFPNVLRIIR